MLCKWKVALQKAAVKLVRVQGQNTFGASMNPGMVTGLAAISGSLVGALSSSVGTWITQRFQNRHDLIGKQIMRREALYSDFIAESARLLVDAMEHSEFDLQKMIPVYALVSRIRLSSSEAVLKRAEQIIKVIVDTYPQPNMTPEQIQFQALDGQDPLREFSDCCRDELDWLQRQV